MLRSVVLGSPFNTEAGPHEDDPIPGVRRLRFARAGPANGEGEEVFVRCHGLEPSI